MVRLRFRSLRVVFALLAGLECGNDGGNVPVAAAVTPSPPSLQQDPSWYYPSYGYRMPLYLDSSNPTSLNDALVRFRLDTAALVDAGKMRQDCNDIRLTYYNPVNGIQSPIDYLVLNENKPDSEIYGLVGTILPGNGVNNGCRKYSTLHEQYGMIYHNHRTYISYVGSNETRHAIFLTYYDHATKDWRDNPVRIDTLYDSSSEENNEHRAPDLIVDGNGYFHIFYGCHGSKMLYKRSTVANDIGSWTTVWNSVNSPIGKATFPKAFFRNGKIWLFWRGSLGSTTHNARTLSFKSATKLSGSWTWSSKYDIIDAGGDSNVTYARGIAMGNETPTASIHVLWHWYDENVVPSTSSDPKEHYKVMYAKSTDGGASWIKADGAIFNAAPFNNDPIVPADCTGASTLTAGHWMRSADVALNSANEARCLYLYWKDTATTELWFAKFVSGAWAYSKVNDIYADLARLYIDPAGGQYEVYGRRGGTKYEAFRFISTDEGVSWTPQRLTYQSWGHASYPIVAREPGAKIRAAWGVGNDGASQTYDGLPRTLRTFPVDVHNNSAGTLFVYYGFSWAGNGESAESAFYLLDDFDDETTNANPSNFTATEYADAYVWIDANVRRGTTGKSCGLYDGSSSSWTSLGRKFFHPAETGGVLAYIRFKETDQNHFPITLTDNNGIQRYLVMAKDDGKWGYYDGSQYVAFPTGKTYTAHAWYKVECYWNCDKDRFYVFIDGKNQTPAGGIAIPGNVTHFTWFLAYPATSGGTGQMWIEDIQVDYNIAYPFIEGVRAPEETLP